MVKRDIPWQRGRPKGENWRARLLLIGLNLSGADVGHTFSIAPCTDIYAPNSDPIRNEEPLVDSKRAYDSTPP